MSWSVLVVAGGVAGIVFWGGFNWTLELTSTEGFCISCLGMGQCLSGGPANHSLEKHIRRSRDLLGLPCAEDLDL
jgi:NapC/NirT cytochrome c family, N-terminal region